MNRLAHLLTASMICAVSIVGVSAAPSVAAAAPISSTAPSTVAAATDPALVVLAQLLGTTVQALQAIETNEVPEAKMNARVHGSW